MHMFDKTCREHEIEHRLTKPNHPWTNGQVERMNRTIKEATVKRYHYDHHDQLRRHLADFLDAYNFARRLKTLKGLTPYEFICKQWTIEPKRFKLEPIHQMPGLNSAAVSAIRHTGHSEESHSPDAWASVVVRANQASFLVDRCRLHCRDLVAVVVTAVLLADFWYLVQTPR